MPSREIHPPHESPWELAARCREVSRLSDDSEVDLQQIARCAQESPVLAQRLIRRANSASLGLRNRVSEVGQAVTVLGADRIRSVVEQLLQETARLQRLSQAGLTAPPPQAQPGLPQPDPSGAS